jgi:D-psicose/D-tagatose/L-ribulose 3-epimerase
MTIILDAFHMNLEEEDPVQAILRCGNKLGIYQVADSNRKGIGLGHINFDRQIAALDTIKYSGPIVLEPAHPHQAPGSQSEVDVDKIKHYLSVSLGWLKNKALILV